MSKVSLLFYIYWAFFVFCNVFFFSRYFNNSLHTRSVNNNIKNYFLYEIFFHNILQFFCILVNMVRSQSFNRFRNLFYSFAIWHNSIFLFSSMHTRTFLIVKIHVLILITQFNFFNCTFQSILYFFLAILFLSWKLSHMLRTKKIFLIDFSLLFSVYMYLSFFISTKKISNNNKKGKFPFSSSHKIFLFSSFIFPFQYKNFPAKSLRMKVKARRREKFFVETHSERPEMQPLWCKIFYCMRKYETKNTIYFSRTTETCGIHGRNSKLEWVEKIIFFRKKSPIHSCRVRERVYIQYYYVWK